MLLLLSFLLLAPAAPSVQSGSAPPPSSPPVRLGPGQAVVLGLVEGITEYLPVSSTGHLILANRFLGLDSPAPAADASGETVWLVPPDPSAQPPQPGVPYTFRDAAAAYAIIIQGGAILAVAVLYWRRLRSLAAGLLGRDPSGLRLLRHLLISFFPAALAGLTLGDWIEARLFGPLPVLCALVAGALLMLAVDRWHRRRFPAPPPDALPGSPTPGTAIGLDRLTPRHALLIGLLQCVALWPGTSRSMMTLVGGYLAGLPPRLAAEYSFLLGLVTLGAASAYLALKDGPLLLQVVTPASALLGLAVSFLSAALAIRWLVSWLTHHGLLLFALYRLALAAILIPFLLPSP